LPRMDAAKSPSTPLAWLLRKLLQVKRMQGKKPVIVFFDVGNTLIYPDPPVWDVYACAMREEGCACSSEEVERDFLRIWQQLRQQHDGEHPAYGSTEAQAKSWWRMVVMRSLERFGSPRDSEGFFERLWEHFARGEAWAVYPDALPTLWELKRRGVRLGLISNWDCRLVRVLKELELWDWFAPRIISFQEGCEKPNRRIFLSALRKSDCGAEQAIHVGDSIGEDVLGAQAVGITPFWLQRGRSHPVGRCEFPVIGELTELLDLI